MYYYYQSKENLRYYIVKGSSYYVEDSLEKLIGKCPNNFLSKRVKERLGELLFQTEINELNYIKNQCPELFI